MRSANTVVAEKDLGTHYFTSSKKVKQNFDEYDILILAYFIDQKSAFLFENSLIEENWNNPLLLNKHFQRDMTKFSMTGAKRPDVCEINKKLKSKPKEIRKYSCSYCSESLKKEEFCHHPPKHHYYCDHVCRNRFIFGKKKSEKEKQYISKNKNHTMINLICQFCGKEYAQKSTSNSKYQGCSLSCKNKLSYLNGRINANKGISNPQASINGKNSAKKISQTVTGRKRKYLSDGTWIWQYPEKTETEVSVAIGL